MGRKQLCRSRKSAKHSTYASAIHKFCLPVSATAFAFIAVSRAVSSSRNGGRLLSIPELGEDVAYCVQRDAFGLVAELGKDGMVTSRRTRDTLRQRPARP